MDIINTYDQLKANGGGIAICYNPPDSLHGCKLSILGIDKRGGMIVTDPNSSWYDRNMKVFYIFKVREQKKTRLAEATQWVSDHYGEKGPWVRNRMGDYVPERINEAYPIREDR